MSVQVLRMVGRYEIVREVGRGGTAVVYLARQTDLDRLVALKELAAFRAADPDFVERFLRESRLAGSLSHPNIVTVHEYFEHDGTPFIAMEHFERGSLRPLVGWLGLAQVGGVLEGLLAGLAHAERRGIVHRDLKPENVMVTSEGGVKIADFGIAKALEGPAARSLTGDGAAIGTPAYMAPELATGAEVGPWTDLYAVGVTAYELLAGRLPFPEAEPALALMLRHANEPPPPLRTLRPELDPALAAWVERLLAKAPAERPRGAATAAEALEEILIGSLGPRWRRHARLSDGPEPDDPSQDGRTPVADAAPTPVLPVARSRGRRRVLLVAVGAVALVAAVVGTVLATRSGAGAPATAPGAPVADVIPPPSERLRLAVAGPAVALVDPHGRVVELRRDTLRSLATLPDPARPRQAVFARGALLVADDEALTALDPLSLAPRAARGWNGPGLLAAAGGTVAAALADGEAKGRVCVVAAGLRLDPCARLSFVPAALGVSTSGRLFVADAGAGAVTSFRRAGDALVRTGAPIPVGQGPHGRLLLHEGVLHVPVERGIAVVDPESRSSRTVRLPVTPSDLWISSTGRLVATLPGVDRVALLDTGAPRPSVVLVAAGEEPVAVGGGPGATAPVLVLGADGRVTKLDPRTGAILGARRIAALGAPPPAPLVLKRIGLRRVGDEVTVTLPLTGGRLAASGLVVRDGTIADGRASFELWQGGISALVRSRSAEGVTVRVTPAAGRLAVTISAAGGGYERLRLRRSAEAVVVTVRRTPSPAATGGSTSTGGTTPPPTQGTTKPPPPKDPPYDVG